MAITHFLLQSNFISTQQTFHLSPFRSFETKPSCANAIALNRNHSSCCIKTASPIYDTKCFITNHKPDQGEKSSNVEKDATKTDINLMIWKSIENAIKALKMPLITVVLLGSLLMYDHHHCRLALAATGGRMGGRSSSSRSSSTRSSSRSSSRSSGSRSYSSSSKSPSYNSSKIYTTQTDSTAPMNTKAFQPTGLQIIIGLSVTVGILYFCITHYLDSAKTSVLKLQVGSLGTGRLLQKDLNQIAESADTSTLKGLNDVLQETILALLRHSDHCISSYSFVDVKSSVEEGEKRFDQISIEERGKFDEETLVNVNNIKKKSAASRSSNGLCNEYIVVTIAVLARGCVHELQCKSSAQLKEALQKLASIPSSNIIGVEVLWTPQKEDDSLTEQEMLQDYPLLHPL